MSRLAAHYARLAPRFDALWTYSPAYVDGLAGAIVRALEIAADDRVVDLGAGTGLYARAVRRRVPLRRPLLCVDLSPELLAQIPAGAGLEPLCMDARAFARAPGAIDKVWMKETIHHLPDHAGLLADLAGRLAPGGRILVLLYPPRIELPFFDAAHRRYEAEQPDYEDVAAAMRAAGLRVRIDRHDTPLRLDKEAWLEMLASRYMSFLSAFDDAALAAGIAEVRARHAGEAILAATDRFMLVLGARAG